MFISQTTFRFYTEADEAEDGGYKEGGQNGTPGTAAEWQSGIMTSGIDRGRVEFQIIISAEKIRSLSQPPTALPPFIGTEALGSSEDCFLLLQFPPTSQ